MHLRLSAQDWAPDPCCIRVSFLGIWNWPWGESLTLSSNNCGLDTFCLLCGEVLNDPRDTAAFRFCETILYPYNKTLSPTPFLWLIWIKLSCYLQPGILSQEYFRLTLSPISRGLLTPILSASFCISYPPLSLYPIAFVSIFPSHTSKQVYLLQSEPPVHSTARTINQNSSLIISLPCLQQFWSLSRAFGSKSKLPAQCMGAVWCGPAFSPMLLPLLFGPL